MPQTEQIEKQMEELRQDETAAEEQVRRIVEDLKLKLEADQTLTLRGRYFTWDKLGDECGFIVRTWGQAF